jgi:hypothetical protein
MSDEHASQQTDDISLPGAERRVALRSACALDAVCRPVAEGEPEEGWPASVCDLSTVGVGLLVARAFEPGKLLKLEVQTDDLAYTLLTRVVHATQLRKDNLWLVGCAFVRPLEEAELANLL